MMKKAKLPLPLWLYLSVGLALLAHVIIPEGVVGLSSSSSPSKRPIVSLAGEGDVSGFLYGKLQRATSIYGSGLVGPATAIVHGQKDRTELLPPEISSQSPQTQLKGLEKMLWNQFGMATCEGSVDREDLLTPMSYLKPKLCDLKDTLLFLDATATSMGGATTPASGGLGGLFSSLMGSKKDKAQSQQKQQQQRRQHASKEADSKGKYWLDIDLVRSGVTRGSRIFVVCESHDTEECARALMNCLRSLGEEANGSIVTLVSPDDNVQLGGTNDDSNWNSLRPQDLEGELSKIVAVRDGTADCFPPTSAAVVVEKEVPTFKRTREERLAAAYAEVTPTPEAEQEPLKTKGSEARIAAAENYKPPSTISMHDLAEVCVQCALRLPSTTRGTSSENDHELVRLVRVAPVDENSQDESAAGTKRPNSDYFTLTGGPKARAKAGVVSSVDWTKTLSCFVASGEGSVGIKEFPKRPDVA